MTEVRAPYSAIMAGCFQLAHEISDLRFVFCPRDANRLAHTVARHAYESKLVLSWEDEPPVFILPHVLSDVTFSIFE